MASPLASCWTPVGRCASGPASSSETAVRVTHGLPTRRTTRHRAGVSNGGNSIPSVSAATRPPRRPQTRALRAFAVDRNEVLEDNESGLLPSSQRSFDKRSGKASGAVDAPLRSRDDSASSQKTVTRANASLADYCTLGVGGPARFLVEAYTTHQLVQTLRANAQEKINTVVIGKGSNVLFEDKGFDGCALVNKIEFVEEVFFDDALDDAIDDDATEAVSLLGVCSIGERHETTHPLHQNRRTNKSHAESDDAAAAAATATQKHENRRTDNKSRAETQNKSTSLESSLESNNNPQHKFIKVGSGTAFNHLGVAFSKRGWAGLEFAVGVPGTAGGAVFMNAGADGQDTASVLWQVEVVSPDGSEIRSLARGDLVGRFGYRTSPFMEDDTGRVFTEDQEEGKHFKATGVFGDAPEDANNFKQVASSNSPAYAGWIILSATFRLTKDSNAPSTAKACMRRRRTTQPLSERSVGCWFRNPGTGAESAGALIDKGTSPHLPNHRRLFYLSAGDCLSIHRDIHY